MMATVTIGMTTMPYGVDANSTGPSGVNETHDEALTQAEDLIRIFHCYAVMVICTVGITANVIALIVFSVSRNIRSTTTGHYLIALTVAATIALMDEGIRQLNAFYSGGQILGLDFYSTNNTWCKLVSFQGVFGRCFGIWMTVIITLERYITVTFPLRVSTISTTCKAKVIIAMVVVFSAGIGIPNIFVNGVYAWNTRMGCFLYPEYFERYKLYHTIIQILFITAVPCVTVAVFTGLIIYRIRRATKQRLTLSKTPSKRGGKMSAEAQLNTLLVSVAVCFIVLRSPYSILYWVETRKLNWQPEPWMSFYIYAAYRISIVLSVLNYGMNFFLYCLCGSTFRRELIRVLCCCKAEATTVVSENGKYIYVATNNPRSRRSNSHSGVFTDTIRDKTSKPGSWVKKNGFLLPPRSGLKCAISVKKYGSAPTVENNTVANNATSRASQQQPQQQHSSTGISDKVNVMSSHSEMKELEIEREVVSDSGACKVSGEQSGGSTSDLWFDCETNTPKSNRQNTPLIHTDEPQ